MKYALCYLWIDYLSNKSIFAYEFMYVFNYLITDILYLVFYDIHSFIFGINDIDIKSLKANSVFNSRKQQTKCILHEYS